MKVKLNFKIFILFTCAIFLASAISGQTKVSEYKEEPVNLDALAEMAGEFAEQIAAEPPATRGFINLYSNSAEAEKIKAVLAKMPELKNRIEFFQPGVKYREGTSSNIEFWLIPKGAGSPYEPNCINCLCPTIKVSGFEMADKKTAFLTFTANVSGGSEEITYAWKISAGKIIEGQGTPTIKVDAQGAKEVTATVKIGGVCEECPREESFTTRIKPAVIAQEEEPVNLYKPVACPRLSFDATTEVITGNPVITFTAKATGGDTEDIIYQWTISAGKIIEGQGTRTIKVDARGVKEVTAGAYFGGKLEFCESPWSYTVEI